MKSFLPFFMLLFFALRITSSYSQNYRDSAQIYLQEGIAAKKELRFAEAMENFSKAEIFSEAQEIHKWLWYIKNNIGLIYSDLSNYGLALDYYKEALDIIELDVSLAKNRGVVFNNIALLYSNEGDTDNALEYLYKAFEETDLYGDSITKKAIGINIASQYIKKKNIGKAREILQEVSETIDDPRIDFSWQIVWASTYFHEGDTAKALKLLEALYPGVEQLNEVECTVCITELLSMIYEEQMEWERAIRMSEIGLDAATNLKLKITFYEALSRLYKKMQLYETAFAYQDSVIISKDSLNKSINRGLFEVNKVTLRLREFQHELKISQEKQKAQKQLLVVLSIGSGIVILLVFFSLRNRLQKQRQKKLLAEKEKKLADLKVENLKQNVAEQNRKLSSKALFYSGRNELLSEVIQGLLELKDVSRDKEIKNYISTLREHLRADKEWDDFIAHFEQVNPGFINRLKTKHPSLNSNDIRFICYIYMNLNLKEISTVFSITYNAAKIRKKRIAEKMQLEKEDSLYDYIFEI